MILPTNLLQAPLVLCFDLKETQALTEAVKRILGKYPNAALVCFDVPCAAVVDYVNETVNVYRWYVYKSPKACIEEYNVIGILCGSDREFPELDRRVMRC